MRKGELVFDPNRMSRLRDVTHSLDLQTSLTFRW